MVYFRRSISAFNKILHYNDTGSIIRKCHGSTNGFSAEHLSNRTVIKVCGESSAEFLQGLITNDINSLKTSNSSTYTLLLNHKGRILYDAIIYRNTETDAFLVECDTHCAEQLTKHLKMYRLRRKIDIEPLGSEYSVWAVYNEGLVDALCNNQETQRNLPELNFKVSGKLVVEDPRVRELGYRVILKSGESLDLPSSNNYLLCRYKLGIGEGVNEIQIGQNFPLEYNCDYLNGVSFSKGCYIGQELTARTYHTGVIRKRIMPLVFEKELKDVPYDTIINDTEVRRSPIGKLKGINSIFGLGLMRVSEALENTNLMCLGVKVKVIVPYWWRVDIANKNNTILNK